MTYHDENFGSRIDAASFQQPLKDLAETLAQKVLREGHRHWNAPAFVTTDIFVLMRQSMYTNNLLAFINADERRESDCYWNPAYTFVAAPLVRSIIDCLYNITLILQDPRFYGPAFRKSGFKKELGALDEDEKRYGGQANSMLNLAIRQSGLEMASVLTEKPWKTMGKYISEPGPGGTLTSHQVFLKTFTYGMWREYSAMAHGGFEGLLDAAVYYTSDTLRHEIRPKLDEKFPLMMSLHMFRGSLIVLCIVTELQAYFRFDGSNINARIHKVWNALMPVFEVKELYHERYAKLMNDRGIKP